MSNVLELTRTDLPSMQAPAARPAGTRRSTGETHQGGGAARRDTGAERMRRAARRSLRLLSTLLLVLAAVVFLLLAVGPRILGYQTSTMLTASMAPLINPGDVVVTVPTPVSDLRVGDIITYHIPVEDNRVETHRITGITTSPDGTTAVQTKGDANNGQDPWIATLQGTSVDRHAATIPYLGQGIRALREPAVMTVLMYGAPAVLVAGILASIWHRDPEPNADPEEATHVRAGAHG